MKELSFSGSLGSWQYFEAANKLEVANKLKVANKLGQELIVAADMEDAIRLHLAEIVGIVICLYLVPHLKSRQARLRRIAR
jgi:SpoU rRNA methylase family enzyme